METLRESSRLMTLKRISCPPELNPVTYNKGCGLQQWSEKLNCEIEMKTKCELEIEMN